jgi:hypothetical protein
MTLTVAGLLLLTGLMTGVWAGVRWSENRRGHPRHETAVARVGGTTATAAADSAVPRALD